MPKTITPRPRTAAGVDGPLVSLGALLREWLPRQRWFAGKDRPVTDLSVLSVTELFPGCLHLLVQASHAPVPTPGGTPLPGDCYQLVLGLREDLAPRLERAYIGRAVEGPLAGLAVYDALHDPRSANLLLELARESFEYGRRNDALRELYAPFVLGWVSRLIAPQGVDVSGVADGDRDGLDDDGRVAFHASGTSVCASLPVSASGSGAIHFSSCRRLPVRHVQIHENARAVFREMKRGADYGASFRGGTPHQRARRAARMAPALSSHSEARAHARGDRVQFRAKVEGRVRYACYRVSPDGHRATYSRSGRPGTWRLGRCR